MPRPAAVLLVLFCAWQLLFPLRHHLYPGPVTWTEEGHKYSWRMKLRDKDGWVRFRLVHRTTGGWGMGSTGMSRAAMVRAHFEGGLRGAFGSSGARLFPG